MACPANVPRRISASIGAMSLCCCGPRCVAGAFVMLPLSSWMTSLVVSEEIERVDEGALTRWLSLAASALAAVSAPCSPRHLYRYCAAISLLLLPLLVQPLL